MIGYISLNMVKSQFTNTWQVNIEPEHSFQRRWRELAAIKLVFFKWFGLYCNTDCWFYCSNDCYWFEDLSVSKASKAESAIPPVNWWKFILLDLGFNLKNWNKLFWPQNPKWVKPNWCRWKKIHQHWASILFLTNALDMVRFPCRQHSRWAGKARLIRFWCRKGNHTGTLMIIASIVEEEVE